MTRCTAGILVGGAARRMGGLPKGLLPAADGVAIVDRWRAMLDALGVGSALVGAHEGYAPRATLADAAPGAGPLGGVVSLLRDARPRATYALALGCDMPHVTAALLSRLVAAPDAVAVAPKRDGRWEPLFARYDVARALPVAERRLAAGELSLQGLLDALDARALALTADEARSLDDWDTPEDVARRPA